MNKLINIGIFAHVDAGKTTLSERMLLLSGGIRSLGAVDEGTAHTDRLAMERRRGISIRSACAPVIWKDTLINIVDTPGHADFASETERALWAIDGAILVISGTDGVQAHTETLWRILRQRHIPTIAFVNKLDREVADFDAVIGDIRLALTENAFDLNNEEDLALQAGREDEGILDDYLTDGSIENARAYSALTKAMKDDCLPVLGGSALTGKGVTELMDAITGLLPSPEGTEEAPLSGIVFALENDATLGRAAWVRLFSGKLRNRDTVHINIVRENAYGRKETTEERKISQIRTFGVNGASVNAGEMKAGDIACVYGLNGVRVGQVLGEALPQDRTAGKNALKQPLYYAFVSAENREQNETLGKALEMLSQEDPMLETSRFDGAYNIRLMGHVHMEVLEEELLTRFGVKASFGPSRVIYKETIAQPTVGFVAYTMPKPCWAVIKVEMEPLPRGSGVIFESACSPEDIKYRYQHQVEQAIPLSLSQGMYGWQVDDIRIRLVGGGDHDIHTHPLDFIVATPMAVMDGLRRAGTILMEPVLEGTFLLPEDKVSRLIGEITAIGGHLVDTGVSGRYSLVVAEYPAAAAGDLPEKFARITGGRGIFTSRLSRYAETEATDDKICPRRGVNPLDTSKYILAARSALEGGIFDA